MDAEAMVFCYLNFVSADLIHVIISDESDKFPELSEISKSLKHNIESNSGVMNAMGISLQSSIKKDPSFERSNMVHHFLIYNMENNQLLQSSGNNFGYNSDKNYLKYIHAYGELYEYYLKTQHNRK